MSKKTKVIATVLASSSIIGGVAVINNIDNHALVINDIKIKDISKIKKEDLSNYSRETNIDNENTIKKVDKLELINFSSQLDNKSSNYIINVTFKNSSEISLHDLKLNFTLYGAIDELLVKDCNKKELKSGEEFSLVLNIPISDILDVCIENKKSKNTSNIEEILNTYIENNSLYLGYDYTYSNIVQDNLLIKNELDFNGNIKYRTLRNFEHSTDRNLPKTHVESGAYLNLVKPEEKNPFNCIDTINIRMEIDDKFNFKIIGDFENISDTTLDSFSFQPKLMLFGYPISFNSTIVEQDKKAIEPGDSFRVETLITMDDIIINELVGEKIQDTSYLKNKTDEAFLGELLKRRLLSLGYNYYYTIGDYTTSVYAAYTSTSKLLKMNLFEYETIVD